MTVKGISRKQLGALGEQYAFEYLRQQGYRVIQRNWRCRTGEIDLIAWDGPLLVFVEVRTRTGGSGQFGSPQESVDYRKQLQVMETAQVYAHTHQLQHQMRFDVVSVITDKEGNQQSLDHIMNAF
ncbi:YraN family protein [Paenibacillus sp. NPDC056579]|uniref:YraN family protein n=1 Tax=unclassified Paenibacillus TaxID=185978 RepID=UPI001EF8C95D|nr:YraN family protein [Paenibacillus sp. H1-7]ULL17355.1 YraN family protein [Paenibacillus sp. H1-7]